MQIHFWTNPVAPRACRSLRHPLSCISCRESPGTAVLRIAKRKNLRSIVHLHGGFQKSNGGTPTAGLENPNRKWMKTGATPISGTAHMYLMCVGIQYPKIALV